MNSAPSPTWPRLFQEVTVPFPQTLPHSPLSWRPAVCSTHAWNCSLGGLRAFSPSHPGKSPALPPPPRPAVAEDRAATSFPHPPRATSGPLLLRSSGAKTPNGARAGGVPAGGGGGAQARSVPRWAPGRPGSCLLPPRARRTRRANCGRLMPRRP